KHLGLMFRLRKSFKQSVVDFDGILLFKEFQVVDVAQVIVGFLDLGEGLRPGFWRPRYLGGELCKGDLNRVSLFGWGCRRRRGLVPGLLLSPGRSVIGKGASHSL